MKKIILILFCCVCLVGITGCSEGSSGKKAQIYHLGDSFNYNGFEITLGNEYKKVPFSVNDAITVPITITNKNSSTTELKLSFTLFNPNGSEGRLINGGLKDTNSSTKMQSEGKIEDVIYFVYEGEGTYTLEINDSKTSIELPIT